MNLCERVKLLFKKQELKMQFVSITEPDEDLQKKGYDPKLYSQVNYSNGIRNTHTIISKYPL